MLEASLTSAEINKMKVELCSVPAGAFILFFFYFSSLSSETRSSYLVLRMWTFLRVYFCVVLPCHYLTFVAEICRQNCGPGIRH